MLARGDFHKKQEGAMLWKIASLVFCLVLTLGAGGAMAAGKVAVIVVDVQGDFTTAHKGTLAVNGTDQAFLDNVAKATDQLKAAGLPIYATQDWHPANHMSFASNHKGQKPFTLFKLSDGRTQMLWTDHCVQNTKGAELLMDKATFVKVVQKGKNPNYDSYSGFQDDGGEKTEMNQVLKSDGVGTVIVYGIATDYCVKATAMDAMQAGYKVVVVKDLCRGVAPKTSKAAWVDLQKAGAMLWDSVDMAKVKALN
jgi:nicotinamidase/pyrazinamidase